MYASSGFALHFPTMNRQRSRRIRLLTVMLLFSLPLASTVAQHSEGTAVQEPDLREELLRRAEEDRSMRQRLISADAASPSDEGDLEEAVHEMDRRNTEWLKEIVAEFGWPTAALVGKQAVHAGFLLLQHSPDLSFQERMLPEVRESYEQGVLAGQQYALLYDRIRVRQDRPQRYGTQVKPVAEWEDGQPTLHPVEDRATLPARRRSLNLPAVDTYLDLIERLYGNGDAAEPPNAD